MIPLNPFDHIDPAAEETAGLLPAFDSLGQAQVLEFAGVSVPEDGVSVSVADVGTLTVWPNGQYVLTCSMCDAGELPVIHFPYLAVDEAGMIFNGSLAVNDILPLENSEDAFQGWTLDDILELDTVLTDPEHIPDVQWLDSGETTVFGHGESVHVTEPIQVVELATPSDPDPLDHLMQTNYEL